jgi:threonine/homoserine/homoserine lactone efflux protein
MLVLSYALTRGRAVATRTALGVALGDFIAMSASLLGLGAIVLASATVFTVLKWVGAVYLVWLGVKLLRTPVANGLPAAPDTSEARSVFWHACTVTALNPKSIAFFIAFVPQFVTPEAPIAPQFAILIATFCTLALVNVLIYAFLADRLRSRIRRPSTLRWLNRAGGSALVGMGALTATMQRT